MRMLAAAFLIGFLVPPIGYKAEVEAFRKQREAEIGGETGGAALTGFGAYGIVAIGAALACRLVLQLQVDLTLRVRADRWWLGAARDLLAIGIHVASYFVSIVSWRGRRYRVRSDGTMIAIGEPNA